MAHNRFKLVALIFIFTFIVIAHSRAQSMYEKTPADAEGPFYPVERQADEDNDLLQIAGKSQTAKGDVLYLTGIVTTSSGEPLSDVSIEIWQTDVNGLYRHPRDRSKGTRDPFFQYWGRATTDDTGKYSFRTILPGEYEPRPPHIHFKVWLEEREILTSQMYIAKSGSSPSYVDELLHLDVSKNSSGVYRGFFRIVL